MKSNTTYTDEPMEVGREVYDLFPENTVFVFNDATPINIEAPVLHVLKQEAYEQNIHYTALIQSVISDYVKTKQPNL